jgi:hypothetical protein
MRIFFCFVVIIALAGCGDRTPADKGSQNWEPHGLYDASELFKVGDVLLFSGTGHVMRYFPDRHPEWMGLCEMTNGVWVYHLYANHWRIEPETNSLLFIELGDPKNPLLRNPTNRFRLPALTSMPKGYRTNGLPPLQ